MYEKLQSFIFVLNASKPFFYFLVVLISLCIGSFLNVVIHRLPIIMKREWEAECYEFINQPENIKQHEKLTLSTPRSSCPSCKQKIKWYQNIPVISWVLLRGKCSNCGVSISAKYPLIELLTCGLSVAVAYTFGPTLQTVFGLIFVWSMIALAFIDLAEQFLPDRIVLPLLGLGLIINVYSVFVPVQFSVWGAVIGWLCLLIVGEIFKAITKKDGMGHGDFKLLAIIGAWFSAFALPTVILGSSILGIIVGITLLKKNKTSEAFAFGPYIAIMGVFVLLFGKLI